MGENLKFLLQTLIIPIVLAFFGYKINKTISDKDRAYDKLKFTNEIVKSAFEGDNASKALALIDIIPHVIDDKTLSDALTQKIKDYYENKLKAAGKTGDDVKFNEIAAAIEVNTNATNNLKQIITQDPTLTRADSARKLEEAGMAALNKGDLEDARKKFKTAEAVFPSFHSAYEISNLISQKQNEVAQGQTDNATAKKEVLKEVKSKYNWKMNMNQAQQH